LHATRDTELASSSGQISLMFDYLLSFYCCGILVF
jgi:hypothetical protein